MKKKSVKKAEQGSSHRYTAILEPDEGGYHAFCPALPGCHTQGDTFEEALENIKDAINLYCESLRAHGEPLPEEKLAICQMVIPA